jgi:hypothetical protein
MLCNGELAIASTVAVGAPPYSLNQWIENDPSLASTVLY